MAEDQTPAGESTAPQSITRLLAVGAFSGAIYGFLIGRWLYWSKGSQDWSILVGACIGVIGTAAGGFLLGLISKGPSARSVVLTTVLGLGFGVLSFALVGVFLFSRYGPYVGVGDEAWMYLTLFGGSATGGTLGAALFLLRIRFRLCTDIIAGTLIIAIVTLLLVARFG